MKRMMLLSLLLPILKIVVAQELFVYTEPASNMAKGLVGIRLNNTLMLPKNGNNQYYLTPEIMIGASKKLMFHADGFFSNSYGNFTLSGGSLYTKYRFLSKDAVQQHLRMAVFGRYSYNNSPVMQQEIETVMFNSGYKGGVVATQLLHKTAISSSVSYEQALNNGGLHKIETRKYRAMDATLSVGRLVLPRQYKNFKQTNLNLMLELLGQYNTGLQKSYIDVAPSAQFIFSSRWRVDAAWRKKLYSGLQRVSNNSFLVRLEYNFFNVF